MIKPTVGRKVWYRPLVTDGHGPHPMLYRPGEPLDATVLAVWGDRMVNVLVFDIYGKPFTKTSIQLLQEGDVPPLGMDGKPLGGYVEWMPYQQGQAKKHEVGPMVAGDAAVLASSGSVGVPHHPV